MKVKVNWKELGKQLWAAVKQVLLAAIGISTGRRPQLLLALDIMGTILFKPYQDLGEGLFFDN